MAAILVPVEVLDQLAQATLELARAIVAELFPPRRAALTPQTVKSETARISRELLRRLWDGVELAERGRVTYRGDLAAFFVEGMPTKKGGQGKRYMVTPGECECEDHTWRAPKGRCKHIAAVNAIVLTGRFYSRVDLDAEEYRAEAEKFDVAYDWQTDEEVAFFV